MSTIIGDAARMRKVHMLKSAKSLSTLRKALENDVIWAAQKLLGMELVRGNLRARIVETDGAARLSRERNCFLPLLCRADAN